MFFKPGASTQYMEFYCMNSILWRVTCPCNSGWIPADFVFQQSWKNVAQEKRVLVAAYQSPPRSSSTQCGLHSASDEGKRKGSPSRDLVLTPPLSAMCGHVLFCSIGVLLFINLSQKTATSYLKHLSFFWFNLFLACM